jgi:DNA-binding NarL/FixJ family response regulator
MNKLRIFVAYDHQIIRDGLKGLINAEPDMEVVGEAGNGQTAIRQVLMLHPDIVIMDIAMPGLSGTRATQRIKRECPEVKVIALTAYEEKGYVGQMLQAGAYGYVLKLAAAEELIKAMRIVSTGEQYLDSTVSSKVINSYVQQKAAKAGPRHPGTLTEREEEVLQLVARGYINKEIATRLDISVKTVETHKRNFMEKLGLHSRAELVRYALGQGWLLSE